MRSKRPSAQDPMIDSRTAVIEPLASTYAVTRSRGTGGVLPPGAEPVAKKMPFWLSRYSSLEGIFSSRRRCHLAMATL